MTLPGWLLRTLNVVDEIPRLAVLDPRQLLALRRARALDQWVL